MYFNYVNIGYYMLLSILGLFMGELVNWMNKRLPDEKPIITRGAITTVVLSEEVAKDLNIDIFTNVIVVPK